MIYDKITNIGEYNICESVKNFIHGLSIDIETGKKIISPDTYANIEEYTTKLRENCRLEAHKKYTDIQILLEGPEELAFTNIDGLKISEDYNAERDIMFFECPDRVLNKVVLKSGYFALLTPDEAHQPQVAYNNQPSRVKKVVIKLSV